MTKGLWKRVQQIAKEREISNLRLRELMADRGLRYDPIYMDSFRIPTTFTCWRKFSTSRQVLFEARPI